jgi:hypothetical protein
VVEYGSSREQPGEARPPYGETVVSWRTIDQQLNPETGPEPELSHVAADMNRLRGLIMAQCGETEAVLGLILAAVAPTIDPERKTAGQLLTCVRQNLPEEISTRWQVELDEIGVANRLRNQAVHSDVHIGSTWVDYQTGGGHYEPVISLMRHGEYGEADLSADLAVQQHATVAAVRLLHAIS